MHQGSTNTIKIKQEIPIFKTPTSMKSEDHVSCVNIGVSIKRHLNKFFLIYFYIRRSDYIATFLLMCFIIVLISLQSDEEADNTKNDASNRSPVCRLTLRHTSFLLIQFYQSDFYLFLNASFDDWIFIFVLWILVISSYAIYFLSILGTIISIIYIIITTK